MPGSHSPRQNHLLGALPAEVYERLLPQLQITPSALTQRRAQSDRRRRRIGAAWPGATQRRTQSDRRGPRIEDARPAR